MQVEGNLGGADYSFEGELTTNLHTEFDLYKKRIEDFVLSTL